MILFYTMAFGPVDPEQIKEFNAAVLEERAQDLEAFKA